MGPYSSKSTVRAMDLLIHAPVGMVSLARDFLPGFATMCVSRGRAEVQERRALLEDRLDRARDLGRTAANHAPHDLRRDLEEWIGSARVKAEEKLSAVGLWSPVGAAGTPAAGSGDGVGAATASAPSPNGGESAGGADELAIPGYDALAAAQVVDRLAGLRRDELEAVRVYEASHRARRTILGRIEQLAR